MDESFAAADAERAKRLVAKCAQRRTIVGRVVRSAHVVSEMRWTNCDAPPVAYRVRVRCRDGTDCALPYSAPSRRAAESRALGASR